MKTMGFLWAIGYEDIHRAAQVKEEVVRLRNKHFLLLLDWAVAVRYPDGSFTVDGEAPPSSPTSWVVRAWDSWRVWPWAHRH
jgi:hypothetical protein